jgi:hypothetical protein
MKSARHEPASTTRQLAMALDSAKLRGMTAAERNTAIAHLASLLMEAAGTATTENADEHV